MQAILLSIGDELALGQTVDTNTAWVADRLTRLGIDTLAHQTVADDLDAIAAAFTWAAERSDLIIASGGLGPTEDDMTRQALAQAMGVDLVLDQPSLDVITAFFAARDKRMAPQNRVQAMHPAGSAMIPNAHGTAPGIHATLNDTDVYLTPGVPREMKHMVGDTILSKLASQPGRKAILTTKINTFGLGESDTAEILGELMDRDRNPTVGTTVAGGVCSARIRAVAPNPDEASAMLEDTAALVTERLGPLVYSRDDGTLAEATVECLKQRGQTVATAESCTGGLVGGMITDVAGSSAVYNGGWVTYSNAMKAQQLEVPEELLEQHGAVSATVAAAMADNARRLAHADLAVSLTGIAGPGGGSDDKPIGTVYLGLSQHDAPTDVRLATLGYGGRAGIRRRAALCALQAIRLGCLDADLDSLTWLKQVPVTTPT
ncbi:MAG: competence/damage-inducible protein A [Planctomycetota bacterium]